MPRYTVNGEGPLQHCIKELRQAYEQNHFLTVTISTGKKRTLPQNSCLHGWCAEVAKREKEHTPPYLKALWKLLFGVPICIREEVLIPWFGEMVAYGEFYEKVLAPLPFEQRVAVMEVVPCTSLLNTAQMTELLESIRRHYIGRVELEFDHE